MTDTILHELQFSLVRDLTAFLPELLLCGAIVLMLLLRLFRIFDQHHLGWLAFAMTCCALVASWMQWLGDPAYDPRGLDSQTGIKMVSLDLFSGLLVFDNFAIFIKLFLFGFTALVILMALLTGIPDRADSADFFTLLLGAAIGMSVMASSNHLLMVFLGVEMASVPSYALAGFLKGRRQSSEAALKYVVYGGGAAGVMLYGISLVAGRYGTGYLPDLVRLVAVGPLDSLMLLGVLFILIGIAFKLAAVPFHFWCPDVFEGAPAEVGAFLSVASKGAALALLARIVYGLGGLTIHPGPALHPEIVARAWNQAVPYLVPILSFFAVLTTTFGNLAAYGQTNLKRLLAYSTIAHAGFMMMGLATMTRDGAGAMLFYLIVYLIMNLGAFTVIAFLRNQTGVEDLRFFRGLVGRAPVLVIALSIFLLSLLGMPPLAGFTAKFQIFTALFDAARMYNERGQPLLGSTLYAVLVAGGLNTVLALFYYIKVLKVMILEKSLEEVEGQPVVAIPLAPLHGAYVSVLALVLLFLGIFWNPLAEASGVKGVDNFHRLPAAAAAAPVELAKGAR
jgi:NADH-quinone oxidoreductase subunit N